MSGDRIPMPWRVAYAIYAMRVACVPSQSLDLVRIPTNYTRTIGCLRTICRCGGTADATNPGANKAECIGCNSNGQPDSKVAVQGGAARRGVG